MNAKVFGFLMFLAATHADASPIVVDGNGAFVGFYNWVSATGTSENAVSQTGYRFTILRRLGYVTWLDGAFIQIGFTTGNCTGAGYAPIDSSLPGYVAPVDNAQPSPVYYVPQNAVVQVIPIGSYLASNGACVPQAPVGTGVFPAFPNDPNVTGVNATWPLPLRVTSSWIFRDGFEEPLSGITAVAVQNIG